VIQVFSTCLAFSLVLCRLSAKLSGSKTTGRASQAPGARQDIGVADLRHLHQGHCLTLGLYWLSSVAQRTSGFIPDINIPIIEPRQQSANAASQVEKSS